MVRASLVVALVGGLSGRAYADDIRTLEGDLQLAYELLGNSQHPIDDLEALRARAERLTHTTATLGLDVARLASVPGAKLRVLGGNGFVVIVDRKNEPVGWYALETGTIAVHAASPRLVEIVALGTMSQLVIDLTTVTVPVVGPGLLQGGTAPSPDGKRLATVDLTMDENGGCSAQLFLHTASGQASAPSLGSSVPPDSCQGDVSVVWKRANVLVTSGWSEGYLTIDVRSGAVTTVHGKAPVIRPPRDRSHPLTDQQRATFAKVGCTVAGRFMFPTAACDGVTAEPPPTKATSPAGS